MSWQCATSSPNSQRLADAHRHRGTLKAVALSIEQLEVIHTEPAKAIQLGSHTHGPGPFSDIRGAEPKRLPVSSYPLCCGDDVPLALARGQPAFDKLPPGTQVSKKKLSNALGAC